MPGANRVVMAVAGAAAIVLALAACGTPPWEAGTAASGSPSAPSSRIPVARNDLSAGPAKHTLQAGDVRLDVTYFSHLDLGKWYAVADKPLSLSATASLGSDHGEAVYLSRVTVGVTVQGPAGALPAPALQRDEASVQPGYVVKSPYSYGSTFIIPPVDASARSLTVSIVYELLVQTTPTSTGYAKVSTADTLTIALARP